jgi:dGTPase
MEVAATARSISRALKLNEDLTETIALAHDLGHSPVGHKGETVLNRLMRGYGGFEHNRQSLRIVEELEQKYPDFSGLNLTWEVREGLMKHFLPNEHPSRREGFAAKSSSLEAQVANLADEISYYTHDLDDGLDAGLLSETQLKQEVVVWRQAAAAVEREHGKLPDESRRYFVLRSITDHQIKDVVVTTEENIFKAGVESANEVRLQPKPLIQYSAERRRLNLQLRKFLYKNLYYNRTVHEPNQRAVRMLEELFLFYLKHPREIGSQARKRERKDGRHRVICDYIAGMTEYERLIGRR